MTDAERPGDIKSLLAGRSIVLVGLMGCGKSAIGRRLAARLELPFVDADEEIETAHKMTISEIFAEYGEEYFRDGERRVIARLLSGGPQVLATGGGAFIQPETRADIAASGIPIWLKADQDVLMARVKRRSNRPLLKTDDPETTMTRLIAERYPIYAEAPIQVQSRDVSHDVVLDDILSALDDYLAIAPEEAGIHG